MDRIRLSFEVDGKTPALPDSTSEMPWGEVTVSTYSVGLQLLHLVLRFKSLKAFWCKHFPFWSFFPFFLTVLKVQWVVTYLITRAESCNIPPHKLVFAPVISHITLSKIKLPISWIITIQIQIILNWSITGWFMVWVLFNISAETSSMEQVLLNVTEQFWV